MWGIWRWLHLRMCVGYWIDIHFWLGQSDATITTLMCTPKPMDCSRFIWSWWGCLSVANLHKTWLQSTGCRIVLTTASPSKPQFLCGKEGTEQKNHMFWTISSNKSCSSMHVGMAYKQHWSFRLGKLNNGMKLPILVLCDWLPTVLAWVQRFLPLMFGLGSKLNRATSANSQLADALRVSSAPGGATCSWTGKLVQRMSCLQLVGNVFGLPLRIRKMLWSTDFHVVPPPNRIVCRPSSVRTPPKTVCEPNTTRQRDLKK